MHSKISQACRRPLSCLRPDAGAGSGLSPDPAPASGRRQDNGLLQAWEIFECMHLDADLVILSACDTALGKEMRGEGLVGLTRAFQYAGARTVLASLWRRRRLLHRPFHGALLPLPPRRQIQG